MKRTHVDLALPRAAGLLLGAMLLAAGCVTADGTILQDGGATLTVSFPTVATADNDQAARALVSSPDVIVESVKITEAKAGEPGPRRATARVTTKDVTKLANLPLLRIYGTTITRDAKADGGGTITVKLKNPSPKSPDDPEVARRMKEQVRVTVNLPGPVVETSATKKNETVEWTFPAGEFTVGKKLELSATYAPPPAGGTASGAS
jgi:hypothetical protein